VAVAGECLAVYGLGVSQVAGRPFDTGVGGRVGSISAGEGSRRAVGGSAMVTWGAQAVGSARMRVSASMN